MCRDDGKGSACFFFHFRRTLYTTDSRRRKSRGGICFKMDAMFFFFATSSRVLTRALSPRDSKPLKTTAKLSSRTKRRCVASTRGHSSPCSGFPHFPTCDVDHRHMGWLEPVTIVTGFPASVGPVDLGTVLSGRLSPHGALPSGALAKVFFELSRSRSPIILFIYLFTYFWAIFISFRTMYDARRPRVRLFIYFVFCHPRDAERKPPNPKEH